MFSHGCFKWILPTFHMSIGFWLIDYFIRLRQGLPLTENIRQKDIWFVSLVLMLLFSFSEPLDNGDDGDK